MLKLAIFINILTVNLLQTNNSPAKVQKIKLCLKANDVQTHLNAELI